MLTATAALLLGVAAATADLGRLFALAAAALLVIFATQAFVLAGMLRWLRRQESGRTRQTPETPQPPGGPGGLRRGAGGR